MFSTKKDIDRHVKTSLNKLPENERFLRGLAIARQYFKLNEYASAEHWLSCYLSVQEDSAPAHKLLGQCYEKQQKFDRAITSYQRSLQLDSKQTGLITDVCKLLLMDDNLTKHLAKAKHWCDLAESERINHEAVLNLKLKVANKDASVDNKLVKDIILREILARPLDPSLRVRLVDYFVEEKRLDEAFKYCFDLEMKFSEPFMHSIEWTNAVADMLLKYSDSTAGGGNGAGQNRSWNYYLLQGITLDRQIYLNLLADSAIETIKRSNIKEITHKLFQLDQLLRQVAEKGRNAAPQKQMADAYLRHYRGQLLLYSASLLFKSSQESYGTGRARETGRKCLALLLLSYQCGIPSQDEPWLKQSSEMARQLVGFWAKQGAFRCCQAGRTLLSCVEEDADVSVLAQIQSVTESKVWTTADDLINQIRQLCSDGGWRQNISRSLYPSGDIATKAASSSYFVHDRVAFGEPQYVLPKREQLEQYLDLAQSLYPSSLPFLVYLGLVMGTDNLADWRCKAFPRLNFSTNNLDNCGVETLNQLDMDSFLYCSVLVAQSNIDKDRSVSQQQGRPSFLPAANLIPGLCEDNKIDWWSAAYHLIKSTTAKEGAANVAEQRQLLQHGMQAIRGTGAPLCDAIVLLKLGQVLAKRAGASSMTTGPEERRHVESRAEAVYRAGVLLWKMRNESSYAGGLETVGSSDTFFKYGIRSYDCQQETVKLAEAAITFLAGVYFKHCRYEEFTQDFGGIPLPFAAFFRAEAFKKLDESNKTPMKAKKVYAERARECIRQTQRYLEQPFVERNHPLNFVLQGELKRLSFANDSFDGSLNVSANGAGIGTSGDESDHFQSFSSSLTNPALAGTGNASGARNSDRETATAASMCLAKTNDLEALIRQMLETLTFVKEDVLGIRNDVGEMQDRLVKIEENIFRKPPETGGAASTPMINDSATVTAATAATAAAMQTIKDMYMMDELQNSASVLAFQHAAAAAAAAAVRPPVMSQQTGASGVPYPNLYGANAYPNYLSGQVQQPQPSQQQQQMLTPRGHPMGTSPMHSAVYQHHADGLLVPSTGSPATGAYHHAAFQQPTLPAPAIDPAPVVPAAVNPKMSIGGGLSIEQSLQTPALLSSWNNTYNSSFGSEVKGGAPVNVVITSSDPLPPQPNVNSSTFAAGAGVQPTYSVTIPPQHIKHSTTGTGAGGSIAGQGSTVNNGTGSRIEMISPAANTKFPMQPMGTPGKGGQPLAPAAPLPSSFFANAIPPAKPDQGVEEDDDDDDDRNAQYDPRPDFQPIIPLPDEIVVRTGEEDEEQIFSGRSKLLRLVDQEWKERGLGELKILRSKADPSQYRIVMRREQVHKICANHYITPELIIKPMEKRKECFIWAAMDFADEEPRKELFCARFGTAGLACEFRDAFVAARDEVAKLRAGEPETPAVAPPPTTGNFSFSSTPKAATTPAQSTQRTATKPLGEFTFEKNYTPPVVTPKSNAKSTEAVTTAVDGGKPSPFASFTFKAQQQPGSPFGNIFGASSPPALLGFDEKDFQCAHETVVSGLKRKEQPSGPWLDCGAGGGTLRLLTSPTAVRLLMRSPATVVQLNHVVDKQQSRFSATEKHGCSWTAAKDTVHPNALSFAVYFKTPEERDRFLAAAQKACQTGVTATKAGGGGFGDLFKAKSGSWDCPACYVNNAADRSQCVACGGPRDPSKADDQAKQKPTATGGSMFGGLAANEANKFSFGAVAPSASVPVAFGSGGGLKKAPEPAKSGGFGDQFKAKPGSWTCNECYLQNGADTLYCVSCESPKDDTVPKKGSGGTVPGGMNLKAADTTTSSKFNFATGGGFTFGMPSTTVPASATVTSSIAGTTTTKVAQPVFGSGFSFGSPAKPTDTAQAATATPDKPVFKFELPTPAGGLSFGSKLAPSSDGKGVSAPADVSKLPEKTTFGFVFKPKSPGKPTVSGDGEAADDDGAGGDTSVNEEENNSYFAPVIPLPDKIDVKTGEEDEDVLYEQRSKLFRFVKPEWKERGIGDVKILKHRETGKLRVVMRREQVLKICLNHALTEDVSYTKKDDKAWQFVANDFSEGNFELNLFSLRFKTADIAQDFHRAVKDALSGKLRPKAVATSSPQPDTTITSTTSSVGDLNFSKLSDISLNDRETAQKLKLPADFFEVPATPCTGCRGCDSDAFQFPAVDKGQLPVKGDSDEEPLPIDIRDVKPLPVVSSAQKKIPFGATPPLAGTNLLSGKASEGITPVTGGTGRFVSSEQKPASSPFLSSSSIFGGVVQTTTSASTTEQTTAGGGVNTKFNFGTSTGLGTASSGGSIFSASLNTTPKSSFISPIAGAVNLTASAPEGDDKKDQSGDAVATKPNNNKSTLLQPASLGSGSPATPPTEGGKLFGSVSFGSGVPTTTNIFGGAGLFGSVTTTSTSTPATGSTPSTLFGSVAFGDPLKPSPTLGSGGLTFGSLAKQTNSPSSTMNAGSDAPVMFKTDESFSFASLAGSSNNSAAFSSAIRKADDSAKPAGEFVGLTIKEDFFSRSATAQLNNSADGTGAKNNGTGGDASTGAAEEESYDPYYAPVIQLPDEIEVRTGEEEETKMFGDRAKLFRFDSTTKEWKERGVGEMKILHHPVRNTYRLLLRREKIFMLVLNHAITTDMRLMPMQESEKTFMWVAFNHAEPPGQLEKLAARFSNAGVASEFCRVLEKCQENLRTRPDLEPDQD